MTTTEWRDLALHERRQAVADTAHLSRVRRQEQAKALCTYCPIQAACAEWAMTSRMPFGVWGGIDEDQRAALWNVPAPRQQAQAEHLAAQLEAAS